MNKVEIIFITIAIIILLACITAIPQYYSTFIFLLVLVILFILMTTLDKYKRRLENRTLSTIAYVIAIILFVMYFINIFYMDFINNGPLIDGNLILFLFFIVMCVGWILEKNRN